MTPEDIKKCKKNGYVWLDNCGIILRVNKGSCLWPEKNQWGISCFHATRAAAQEAIDKRKRLARIAEYRKSMEPITPEQAKDLRDGDEFFYLQAGGGAPRYHVTRDKLDRRPDITKWKCFTEGRAYWTREAAEAALAKQTPVDSHETPVGDTQTKEVVTDEIQANKPTTVRGWLETIPDPAIRGAALGYCSSTDAAKECLTLYRAIDIITSPLWTDEGSKFWHDCMDADYYKTTWPAYPPKAKHEAGRLWEIDKSAITQRTFQTGAKRDTDAGKPRMDLIPPELLTALGNVFRDGAVHYGEHNWEKGIPLNEHIASLLRHVVAVMQGDHSENHDEKMASNVAMFIATARRIEQGKLPRELDTIGWCK